MSDTISIKIGSAFDDKGIDAAIKAARKLHDAFAGALPRGEQRSPIPRDLPADAQKSTRQILALASAQARLQQVTGDVRGGIETMRAAIAQVDKSTIPAIRAMTQLAQAEKKLSDAKGPQVLPRTLDGLSGPAARAAGALAGITLALAGLNSAASAVSGVADYEQNLNVFQATADATDEQMQRVAATAKALGSDMTLPATSAASATTAMLELSKAGLSVNDTMAAAKGTLALAAAGTLEEGKAAEYTANQLNTFRLSGDKAVMVADQLAASANASSAEVKDMADANRMAGAVFASFQAPVVGAEQALTDMNTALALLAKNGLVGSDAGTSLKQSLLQLAAPSDKAKSLMRDLAMRIGESGDIAYTASGQMRPYKEVIDLVGRATADMTQEQRDYTVATIFGADATRAVLTLLKEGAGGWDTMQGAVIRAGAAQDMAAARMKGLNGAVQGLQSQVETLVLNGIEPFLPLMTQVMTGAAELAGTLSGQVGPAATALAGRIQELAVFIRDWAVPSLVALSTTTAIYAATQLPALVATLATATSAFLLKNAAMVTSLGIYAAVALAIGGVVKAYQDLNQKVEDAATNVLESKSWWQESGQAIQRYADVQQTADERTQALARTSEILREQIRQETESLGMRTNAGMVSEEQFKREMDTINQHAMALQGVTGELNTNIESQLQLQAAAITGTAALDALNGKQGELQAMAHITAEDIENLAKAVEENFANGAKAVEGYLNTEIEFINQATQARKDGFDEQEKAQLVSYANQLAAQRAHLGQMLIEYVQAQAAVKEGYAEHADEIIGEIERQFGVQRDLSAQTYGELRGDIDEFVASGGGSLDQFGAKLQDRAKDAIDTRVQMDALAKQYTLEIIDNFDAATGDLSALADQIAAVPARVYSEVIITERRVTETSSGTRTSTMPGGTRATGGPVLVGKTTLVGEEGPELVVFDSPATVIPADETRALVRGGMAGGGTVGGGAWGRGTRGPTFGTGGSGAVLFGTGSSASVGGGGGGGKAAKDLEAELDAMSNVVALLSDMADLRSQLQDAVNEQPFRLDLIQGLITRAREFTEQVRAQLVPLTKEQSEGFERYADAAGGAIDILSATAELRADLQGAADQQPFRLDLVQGLVTRAREFVTWVQQQLVPMTEFQVDQIQRYADAVSASVSILTETADMREALGRPQPPIDITYVRALLADRKAVGQLMGQVIAPLTEEQSEVISRYAAAVADSVSILLETQQLREGLAEPQPPIDIDYVKALLADRKAVGQLMGQVITPLTEEQSEVIARYAAAVADSVSILLETQQMRESLGKPQPPIDLDYVRQLAADRRAVGQIVGQIVAPMTEDQAAMLSRYAAAVGESVSILKHTQEMREALGKPQPPINLAYVQQLADEAVRIREMVEQRLVPTTEAQAEALSRYAAAASDSVGILGTVASLTSEMFTDYVSPTDAQIRMLADDANRITQAVAVAAATYSTEGLEGAKLFAESVGGTFSAFKDGLLFFDALKSGDYTLNRAALAQFEDSTRATLEVAGRLGAQAATIPSANLAALSNATGVLSAQAEALIRLAAVPWGDLPQATAGYAQSGGAGMGGVYNTFHNQFVLPAGSTQQQAQEIMSIISHQLQSRY